MNEAECVLAIARPMSAFRDLRGDGSQLARAYSGYSELRANNSADQPETESYGITRPRPDGTRNFRRHAGDSSAFKNKSARARALARGCCFPVKATYFQLIASRVVRVVMSRAYFLPSLPLAAAEKWN
jgi:hypothetical protein